MSQKSERGIENIERRRRELLGRILGDFRRRCGAVFFQGVAFNDCGVNECLRWKSFSSGEDRAIDAGRASFGALRRVVPEGRDPDALERTMRNRTRSFAHPRIG